METQLKRILKKLFAGSQNISVQCLLKAGNEKETSADYHLSVVRKREEKTREMKEETEDSNENIVTERRKEIQKRGFLLRKAKVNENVISEQRKEVLIGKKSLVWDPRVQNGLLTANQLFNINHFYAI